jgi:hypothetical protein
LKPTGFLAGLVREPTGFLNKSIVVDTTDKGQVAFKWTRGKSNQNINDTGTGKQGFSFYFARYVFRDPFLRVRKMGRKSYRVQLTAKEEKQLKDITGKGVHPAR